MFSLMQQSAKVIDLSLMRSEAMFSLMQQSAKVIDLSLMRSEAMA